MCVLISTVAFFQPLHVIPGKGSFKRALRSSMQTSFVSLCFVCSHFSVETLHTVYFLNYNDLETRLGNVQCRYFSANALQMSKHAFSGRGKKRGKKKPKSVNLASFLMLA